MYKVGDDINCFKVRTYEYYK